MVNLAQDAIYKIMLIVISCGGTAFFQSIRSKLKKIDDSYEKLKIECDNKVIKSDLKEILESSLKPLLKDITIIKAVLDNITEIKVKTNGD